MTAESEIVETAMLPALRQERDLPAKSSGASGLPPKIDGKVLRNAAAAGLIGLLVLLFGIRTPRTILFDENYYVPAAKAITHGSLNMDPGEPPMGKMLMAIGMKVAGDNPLGWRISSAICGALALVAIFLWTQLLFGDQTVSMYAAALTLFNNFLFVMSRVGMMDIFLVFFLLWALVAYTAAFQSDLSTAKQRFLLLGSGFLLGLAGACKWNAVDTLAVLLVMGLALPWVSKLTLVPPSSTLSRFSENLRRVGTPSLLFAMIVVPLFSYWLVYWVLYRAVHLPFGFQDFVQLNYGMWRYHRLDPSHPTMTRPWYQWPFVMSPSRVFSYLMGNPVVMFGGFASMLFCLWRSWKSFGVSEALVVALYAANLLQWAVTPSGAAHYYYYFPAAMFLGVALGIAVHRLPTVFGMRIGVLAVTATVVIFIWCYPRMAHLDAPWDCMLGCWP